MKKNLELPLSVAIKPHFHVVTSNKTRFRTYRDVVYVVRRGSYLKQVINYYLSYWPVLDLDVRRVCRGERSGRVNLLSLSLSTARVGGSTFINALRAFYDERSASAEMNARERLT